MTVIDKTDQSSSLLSFLFPTAISMDVLINGNNEKGEGSGEPPVKKKKEGPEHSEFANVD